MASQAEELLRVWRGPICENRHRGHAVVWHHHSGEVAVWGDGDLTVLPRSSCKMIQALPLVESAAAAGARLGDAHLALACASHTGAGTHLGLVQDWLARLDLGEADLRCGPSCPECRAERDRLIRGGMGPDQRHNPCSGKHAGFLTLARHLGAGPEYLEADHPVQRAVLEAFEDVTGAPHRGIGIDGCSAPNPATGLRDFARALARFAAAREGGDARSTAMVRLREAMMMHPVLVAGEGRACTRLMRAMGGGAAVKFGAEAVYAAILPEQEIGIAVKIEDGTTAAVEAVMAQLLIGAGVLDADHPEARHYTHGPVRNCAGRETGNCEVAPTLARWRL